MTDFFGCNRIILGKNRSFYFHNGLNAVVITLPIRNGNPSSLIDNVAAIARMVITLPIRNGNDNTHPLGYFFPARLYLAVITLPIRNGNSFGIHRFRVSKSIKSLSNYLTYKEWKHSSLNTFRRYWVKCNYLTYKEWKL